jgi:sodium/proline symporter
VASTPALFAALTWKRATRAGGLASILTGAGTAIALDIVLPAVAPGIMRSGDPFGVPSIYPAFVLSVLVLVVVSLLTKPPDRETLDKIFNPKSADDAAEEDTASVDAADSKDAADSAVDEPADNAETEAKDEPAEPPEAGPPADKEDPDDDKGAKA